MKKQLPKQQITNINTHKKKQMRKNEDKQLGISVLPKDRLQWPNPIVGPSLRSTRGVVDVLVLHPQAW